MTKLFDSYLWSLWFPALKFFSILHLTGRTQKEMRKQRNLHSCSLSCGLYMFDRVFTVWMQQSDAPVPLFKYREAAQSGRMYFWKVSVSVSLLFLVVICSDDFHTYSIDTPPPPPPLPFTFLRGIGIPMEVVSSTTLLMQKLISNCQRILQQQQQNNNYMPNTSNAYVRFFFFYMQQPFNGNDSPSFVTTMNRYQVRFFYNICFKMLT